MSSVGLEAIVGRYETAEKLDEGHFAVVYRCRDRGLDRPVVVKLFNPECRVADYPPEFWRARFLMEARAMARIDDEHVAPVLCYGRTAGDLPYFTLPWYPDNLKRRLGSDRSAPDAVAALPPERRPRQLPLNECVRLTGQILRGVQAIHRAGVVHRDLKPANLMLSACAERSEAGVGDVRIVDFGLCRHPDLRLTRESGWLGTEGFMSPEQTASTAGVDFRTDLYAIGVIFYRMLAGILPVGRPQPIDEAFGAPPALARWLAAMTARDPADRPGSAQAAFDSLMEATF